MLYSKWANIVQMLILFQYYILFIIYFLFFHDSPDDIQDSR